MKKWTSIVLCGIFLMVFFAVAQAKPPVSVKMTRGEAKVTLLKGKASAVCDGRKETFALKINDLVRAGCEITTGDESRLEMMLPDRSMIRFADNTKFRLVQVDVEAQGDRDVEISVTVGKIWTNVRKSMPGKKDKFEVSCQNAVAGVRGTVYRVDVANDQSALVKVYDGEVRVASIPRAQQTAIAPVGPPQPVAGPTPVEGPRPVSMEEWVYIVKTMQKIAISADGRATEPETFTEVEDMDDWAKWNRSRDQRRHR
ncbi:MAG: FecR family protein [Deltaproteobacteria bacterium]|jgi:ferric-dicitrate binding protein FerR (iron transport regulator)|nr:FecR domain-containing protein [Syntrophaceae bacterium]